MIEQERAHVDLRNIRFLRLQSFNDESDAFLDAFFSKVPLPNIKEFAVADSAFKEIFYSQRADIDYSKILSQIKKLELKSLHKLNSIGLEHPWMAPLLKNLEVLKVLECSCLTNLAPPTVSFSRLTELHVKDCARLEYLFTSPTAKSLVALKYLDISNCESLETVVAHEEGDTPEEDLTFSELWDLTLSELPKLGSFYTGKSTSNFSRYLSVSITQCKSMKTFSHSDVAPRLLWRVDTDGVDRSKDDVNTAVRQQFEKGSNPELA